jgi:hypothetical protein
MPPPSDDDHRHEFWRRVTDAVAQGLSREVLVIILREVWRHGPW